MEQIKISWLDPSRDTTGVRIRMNGILLGVTMTPEMRTFLVVGRSDGQIVTIPITDATWS